MPTNKPTLPTQLELQTSHVKLWTWLAETGSEDKENWPHWKDYNYKTYWHAKDRACFACQAGNQNKKKTVTKHSECDCCPIEWPEELQCSNNYGLYNKWLSTTSINERKTLALQIAALPWKKEYK